MACIAVRAWAGSEGVSSLRRPNLFSPREKRLGRKERFGGTGAYRVGFRWEIRLVVPVSESVTFPYRTTRRTTIGTRFGISCVLITLVKRLPREFVT